MSSDGLLHATTGHSPVKKNFVARVAQNNKTIKTRTIVYGKNKTLDKAYDEIVIAAKALAKEYRCDYKHKTKKELIERSTQERARETPDKVHQENPLINKFGNELAFKAMIKNAIKHHGLDKTIEVLDSALSLAKGMQEEVAKEKSIITSANIEIARIIVKTRNQGIHMASPSKEIDAAIQWVIDNDNKPKKLQKAEPNVTYKLGKDEWNGVGHAPAAFSQYLNKNENHSLDDLRVT